jgi:hypothetical protein
MNDCALDAVATGCADAWTSGFGIYPALEAAAPGGDPGGDPAGAARAAARAPLQHAATARPGGPPRPGWRRARSAWPHWPAAPRSGRAAADPGTPGPGHEQDVLPGIDIP